MFADARQDNGSIRLRDEEYELVILPPMTHIRLSTLDRLEAFVATGGCVLGTVFPPDTGIGDGAIVDIRERIQALFGTDPAASQCDYRSVMESTVLRRDHPNGGKTSFFQSYAMNRMLPERVQHALGRVGIPESHHVVIETDGDTTRYWLSLPGEEREEITNEVGPGRDALASAFRQAVVDLVEPDVVIDNPEVFYLHRIKDGRDLYFLVNPTYAPQSAVVGLRGDVDLLLWDPTAGAERPIAPTHVRDGRTWCTLALPPVGSAFVTTQPPGSFRIVETNIVVDEIGSDTVSGHIRGGEAFVTTASGGTEHRQALETGQESPPIVIDGDWHFTAEDANTFIIEHWLATPEIEASPRERYAAADADSADWSPVTMGAWAYQLPAEPDRPFPIPVWYRLNFNIVSAPEHLDLIIDGFAGAEWSVFVNGAAVSTTATRSKIDSQMQALAIGEYVRPGTNIIAVRLVLTKATDGLLDFVKICGDFSVDRGEDGSSITEARRVVRPSSWTDQGYPWYSGRGLYRRQFDLPESLLGLRVHLEAQINDDAAEFILNGERVGLNLWTPYVIDISDHVKPGTNDLLIRVANTLINQLEAVPRASGLSGPPRLVPYQSVAFSVPPA
jgi:hypothetical protein